MKTGFTDDPYVKNLKAPCSYTDLAANGLNLNIKQQGGKHWVFLYLYAGKQYDLSLGVYPEVSPKEARKRAIAWCNNLTYGNNPGLYWCNEMLKATENPVFRDYAIECIEGKKAEWRLLDTAKLFLLARNGKPLLI